MSRLQLAQQGSTALARALSLSLNEETSDRAEAWLRNEVCPLVPELARNRSFRLAVRWTGDRLNSDAHTGERRLLEAVDEALVRCATALAGVTVAETEETSVDPENAQIRVPISGSDRATLDLIAGRPWVDLVCCEDFFHPTCELCLRVPDSDRTIAFRTRGELRVPLGDYIARYMFARIDYWKSVLDPIWNNVFYRPLPGNNRAQGSSNRLFDAKINLDSTIDRLRTACCAGSKPRQREACVVLIQVYAAYAQSPDLEWVGLPPGFASGFVGPIRSCVRRRGELITVQAARYGLVEVAERVSASLCDPDVLRQIGAALHEMTPFHELPEVSDDLIDWAKDRARFVMVDRSPRQVFWDGCEVAAGQWDNHPREWNLLWALSTNPERPVDQPMLMSPDAHPIKSRRHRLAQLLDDAAVLDLDGLIDTVRRQGYQLRLSAVDVILLRDAGGDRLVFEGNRSHSI